MGENVRFFVEYYKNTCADLGAEPRQDHSLSDLFLEAAHAVCWLRIAWVSQKLKHYFFHYQTIENNFFL